MFPTHYNVIYDKAGWAHLEPDHFQHLTYKLAHLITIVITVNSFAPFLYISMKTTIGKWKLKLKTNLS